MFRFELDAAPEEKKPALPILWRLAVIGVELGVIAYLSVRLFF